MTDQPFDLSSLLDQAMAMQQQLAEAQQAAAEERIEGSVSGGAVVVVMTGAGEVVDVTISPDVVDPTEVDLLEDLVLAALRDAQAAVAARQAEVMGGLNLPGGLPGLGG